MRVLAGSVCLILVIYLTQVQSGVISSYQHGTSCSNECILLLVESKLNKFYSINRFMTKCGPCWTNILSTNVMRASQRASKTFLTERCETKCVVDLVSMCSGNFNIYIKSKKSCGVCWNSIYHSNEDVELIPSNEMKMIINTLMKKFPIPRFEDSLEHADYDDTSSSSSSHEIVIDNRQKKKKPGVTIEIHTKENNAMGGNSKEGNKLKHDRWSSSHSSNGRKGDINILINEKKSRGNSDKSHSHHTKNKYEESESAYVSSSDEDNNELHPSWNTEKKYGERKNSKSGRRGKGKADGTMSFYVNSTDHHESWENSDSNESVEPEHPKHKGPDNSKDSRISQENSSEGHPGGSSAELYNNTSANEVDSKTSKESKKKDRIDNRSPDKSSEVPTSPKPESLEPSTELNTVESTDVPLPKATDESDVSNEKRTQVPIPKPDFLDIFHNSSHSHETLETDSNNKNDSSSTHSPIDEPTEISSSQMTEGPDSSTYGGNQVPTTDSVDSVDAGSNSSNIDESSETSNKPNEKIISSTPNPTDEPTEISSSQMTEGPDSSTYKEELELTTEPNNSLSAESSTPIIESSETSSISNGIVISSTPDELTEGPSQETEEPNTSPFESNEEPTTEPDNSPGSSSSSSTVVESSETSSISNGIVISSTPDELTEGPSQETEEPNTSPFESNEEPTTEPYNSLGSNSSSSTVVESSETSSISNGIVISSTPDELTEGPTSQKTEEPDTSTYEKNQVPTTEPLYVMVVNSSFSHINESWETSNESNGNVDRIDNRSPDKSSEVPTSPKPESLEPSTELNTVESTDVPLPQVTDKSDASNEKRTQVPVTKPDFLDIFHNSSHSHETLETDSNNKNDSSSTHSPIDEPTEISSSQMTEGPDSSTYGENQVPTTDSVDSVDAGSNSSNIDESSGTTNKPNENIISSTPNPTDEPTEISSSQMTEGPDSSTYKEELELTTEPDNSLSDESSTPIIESSETSSISNGIVISSTPDELTEGPSQETEEPNTSPFESNEEPTTEPDNSPGSSSSSSTVVESSETSSISNGIVISSTPDELTEGPSQETEEPNTSPFESNEEPTTEPDNSPGSSSSSSTVVESSETSSISNGIVISSTPDELTEGPSSQKTEEPDTSTYEKNQVPTTEPLYVVVVNSSSSHFNESWETSNESNKNVIPNNPSPTDEPTEDSTSEATKGPITLIEEKLVPTTESENSQYNNSSKIVGDLGTSNGKLDVGFNSSINNGLNSTLTVDDVACYCKLKNTQGIIPAEMVDGTQPKWGPGMASLGSTQDGQVHFTVAGGIDDFGRVMLTELMKYRKSVLDVLGETSYLRLTSSIVAKVTKIMGDLQKFKSLATCKLSENNNEYDFFLNRITLGVSKCIVDEIHRMITKVLYMYYRVIPRDPYSVGNLVESFKTEISQCGREYALTNISLSDMKCGLIRRIRFVF